jgi:mono/diheme cytochrome c family protein
MCHQTGAVGLPGQFPRLAGRVGPISSKPEGKSYLIDVLSTGLSGQVTIDGQPIIGVMPPFPTLSDDKVAAVLNYLRSLGQAGGADVTAAEVAQLRAAPRKSPGDMMRERKALVQAKIIP